MARSQESFSKKEKEKKRLKKRKDKKAKLEERRAKAEEGSSDDMIAYVDEHGNITDTPPDLTKKKKVKAESIEIGVPKRDKEEYDPIRKGRVEFFNDDKGFGFIIDMTSQEKFFVHISGLIDEIKEGNLVTFELERGMKGMNAVRVKKA
jgi:cold shock CspA family protein